MTHFCAINGCDTRQGWRWWPRLGELQEHPGHGKELEKGLELLRQRLLMLLEPGGIQEWSRELPQGPARANQGIQTNSMITPGGMGGFSQAGTGGGLSFTLTSWADISLLGLKISARSPAISQASLIISSNFSLSGPFRISLK